MNFFNSLYLWLCSQMPVRRVTMELEIRRRVGDVAAKRIAIDREKLNQEFTQKKSQLDNDFKRKTSSLEQEQEQLRAELQKQIDRFVKIRFQREHEEPFAWGVYVRFSTRLFGVHYEERERRFVAGEVGDMVARHIASGRFLQSTQELDREMYLKSRYGRGG